MTEPVFTVGSQPLVIGRAPVLGFATAQRLFAPDWEDRLRAFLAGEPLVMLALAIASPSIAGAARDWVAGRPVKNAKIALRVLAYVVRMATRTTPFGLFATVSLVDAGDETTMTHGGRASLATSTRPDMTWLAQLVEQIESDTELRRGLRMRLNDLIEIRGTRAYVSSADRIRPVAGNGDGAAFAPSSFQWTPGAEFVRETLRAGDMSFHDLSQAVSERFAAAYERAEALIENLHKAGLLVSELRASPVGDPVAHVRAVLERTGAPAAAKLTAFLTAIRNFDDAPVTERDSARVGDLEDAMLQLCGSEGRTLQIDARHATHGTLGRRELDDIARLAEIMTRTSLPVSIAAYRERFARTFEGLEREIELSALVDPDVGIGAPKLVEAAEKPSPLRDAMLFRLIGRALHADEIEATISPGELDALQVETLEPSFVPSSLEFAAMIVARSLDEVAAGEAWIRPGSIHGTPGMGRSLGRFVHVIGDDARRRLRARLSEAHDFERTAELVYTPPARRAMNLIVRPQIFDREVHVGVHHGAHAPDVISATDLIVGLENNHFYIRTRAGERLTINETHVLNSFSASTPICQLLFAQAVDDVRLPRAFHWGAAAQHPFLPRLRCGRMVLTIARWRFTKAQLTGDTAAVKACLDEYRTLWNMPDVVMLAEGDNTLLTDLGSDVGVALLLDQIRHLDDHSYVVLQEALPDAATAWFGPGGHIVETVVSLSAAKPPAAAAPRRTQLLPSRADRTKLPGSDWLYLRVACRHDDFERLIVRIADTLVKPAMADGIVDRWFFVRYADNGPHVRLRLHHDTARTAELLARCNDVFAGFAREGIAPRFVIDTYQREIERYGGTAASCDAAETLFYADTLGCLERMGAGPGTVEGAPAVLSLDVILRALFDTDDAIGSRLRHAMVRHRKLTAEERELTRTCTNALARTERAAIPAWVNAAAAVVRSHAQSDDALAGIAASIVHMHFNRLGAGGASEAGYNQVLVQTYTSLARRNETADARV